MNIVRFFLMFLFLITMILPVFSQQLTDKYKHYEMDVELKGDKIGTADFTLTPENGDTYVVSNIHLEIPFVFFTVVVDRKTTFMILETGGISTFTCDLATNVPGISFSLTAVRQGKEVIVKSTKNGIKKEKKYIQGEDFDYMTGQLTREVFNENEKSKTIRFLDLDNNELEKLKINIIHQTEKIVDGEKVILNQIEFKSFTMKRNELAFAQNDVPLIMEIELPVIGWVRSIVKNVVISDIIAQNE